MKLYWIPVLAVLVTSLSAEVYRWVDEDGNVVFSDQPHPGAEKLDLPEIQTIESTPVPPPAPPATTTADFAGYTTIEITSPEEDATIRDNQGNFAVTAYLEPKLQTTRGHKLVLYMDGKPVNEGGASLVFQLQNIDRGTHSLQVVAVDEDGKEIDRSAPRVVHLKHTSILHPRGPAAPPAAQ